MACKKKSRQIQLLISNKVDIRAKVTRDREGHCIMMKVSVHQENSSLKVSISKTPPKTKNKATKQVKQKLLELKEERYTTIVEDYNILSKTDRTRPSTNRMQVTFQNLWDTTKAGLRRKFIAPKCICQKRGNISNQ